MIDKRIFIFRLNGLDNFIADNSKDAEIIYDQLEHNKNIEHERTELNNMTTTYYFRWKD